MSLLDKILNFGKKEQRNLEDFNPVYGTIHLGASGYNQSKALKLSTVYRCVNLLSDSVQSLPMLPYRYEDNWKYVDYDSTLYTLLNIQPNPFMSAFTFKKLIVQNMLLKGAAYVLIERQVTGQPLSLVLLNSDNIQVKVEDNDVKYIDLVSKREYDKSQVLTFLNYTNNGVTGISTLAFAANTLGIAYSGEEHQGNFFKSGGSMSGILRPIAGASMNQNQAKSAKQQLINQLNSDLGGQSNSIVVISEGLEYQTITVNPKDSQLLESRQFGVLEICRFFNVPPSLAFSETGKFSTQEQQSLDFLNNSLVPLLEKLESEAFRKLFLPSDWMTSELKFDTENLMRLDATTKADYFTKMYQIGALTTNEVREKINAGYPVKGGNRAFNQVNLQPLDNLISENKEVPKDANIDNQLKQAE